MLGTIRTLSSDLREKIIERMRSIVEEYSKAMRCEAKFEITEENVPVTINDEKLAEFARKILSEAFGSNAIVRQDPDMGAEDFSFYANKAPGLFVVLGVKNEKKGIVYPHHHPKFDVDEDVLWIGTATYALLAHSFLMEAKI